jgi:hypothetical protein
MSELFEFEEEVIRMTSDVMDKYERDMADTVTGKNHLPVCVLPAVHCCYVVLVVMTVLVFILSLSLLSTFVTDCSVR